MDAAEMLVSRLQSAESSLSVVQVLITSIHFSVLIRCIHSSKIKRVDSQVVFVARHLLLVAETSDLFFILQEMATIAQNAVRQIHLETKEMAEDQRLSLKQIENAAVAARMKVINVLLFKLTMTFMKGPIHTCKYYRLVNYTRTGC